MKKLILLLLFCAPLCLAQTVTDLTDPGANGVVKRTSTGITAPATATDVINIFGGSCSISTFLRGDGTCAAASGGGGTWGSITGTLLNQTDLQTALDVKAADTGVVHNTGDETIDGNKTFSGITSLADTAIHGQLTTDGSMDFLSTWPSTPCAASGTSQTRICIDTDGTIKQSVNGAAPALFTGNTSWPAGTTAAPGWPGTSHPELGLAVIPSATTFSITNVARTSNVATVTIDTTPFTGAGHLLNWPVGATFKISAIPGPYTAFNGDWTATAVGTNTVTFANSGSDLATTATTGNAQVYSVVITGYEIAMTRFVSTSTNAAHWGSIRLGKTDPITRAGDADPINVTHILLRGEPSTERAQLGESSGVYIPGPVKSTEAAAPAAQAGAADYNLFVDSTSHKLTCKLGSGATDCMPTVTGASGSSLLNKQNATGAVTGTGAAATLVTYTIPGGTMTAGGCIRATVVFQHTTGSASVTYNWSFGGSTSTGKASTNTTVGEFVLNVCNGSTASAQQYEVGPDIIGSTLLANSRGNWTVATASDVILIFQFNVAATDVVTGDMFTVEVLK